MTKLFTMMAVLMSLTVPAHAQSWEPFLIHPNLFIAIDKDSIRAYPGAVFAIMSETFPDVPFTFYKQMVYTCGSGDLYTYKPKGNYLDLQDEIAPSDPVLEESPKYQFDISSYCHKPKDKRDLEVPVALSMDAKTMTTIMVSETKISGSKVSIWTNHYSLTKKPKILNGKPVVSKGKTQYEDVIDHRKGIVTSNDLLDCANDNFVGLSFTKYDQNGKVIESYSTPTKKMTPIPKSVGGQIYKFGCSLRN